LEEGITGAGVAAQASGSLVCGDCFKIEMQDFSEGTSSLEQQNSPWRHSLFEDFDVESSS